jgi:NADPH:quinone reductase-like Zn-dependent oxidoreductase
MPPSKKKKQKVEEKKAMKAMKAIMCPRYGPPEVLKVVEREKPVLKDTEVLIKVYSTSVTNSDIFIRSSNVPLRMLIPFRIMMGFTRPRNEVIGEVFSGIIEQIGSKTKRFQVGDEVYGLTGFSLGAYADYLCLNERDSKRGCIALKPKNISFEEATAAAYGGLLALQYLEKGTIQPNQKVLIYGASGTSGTIAVQYAKSLGCEVTGVCSAEKAEFVRSLGADDVLDYGSEDGISRLGTYDVVLDSVGKRRTSKLKEACKRSLSDKGRYVSIDDGPLILSSDRLNRIKELVECKGITPVNDRCFPFEQMVDAHRYVELGHKKGNVAVTVNRIPIS